MIDSTGVECPAQRIGDMLLTDDFGECCRAIGAIQGHASRLPASTDRQQPASVPGSARLLARVSSGLPHPQPDVRRGMDEVPIRGEQSVFVHDRQLSE